MINQQMVDTFCINVSKTRLTKIRYNHMDFHVDDLPVMTHKINHNMNHNKIVTKHSSQKLYTIRIHNQPSLIPETFALKMLLFSSDEYL